MHIIYFHQHFSTPKGASGIRSYQMAKHFVERGHQVTMVCGSYGLGETGLSNPFKGGKRRGTVDGIDVVEFDLRYSNRDGFFKRSALFMKYALGSVGLALSEKYDVAFATTTPLTVGIPVITARWLRRKKYIFEVRDLWPELPKEMGVITNPIILGMLSLLEFLSYRNATKLVALSPGIAAGIEKRGVDPVTISMIPNGCDLSIFQDKTVKKWRPDGVSENDLMAVFSGTHGMANGLDAVLNAAKILMERNRGDIKLVFIGDGKLKPALMERARQEKIDNVIFHEPVGKAKLAGLLQSADVGIQSLANIPAFYYGTSPNKFFDYISAGLPVVNNYPGWIADMLTEHNCGFAVPPDNAEALANAFEQAADNRKNLQQMGENATDLARRDFDRTKLANKWGDWIESV